MSRHRQNALTAGGTVVLAIIFLSIFYVCQPRPKPEVALSNLSNLQEKAVDLIVEANKLVISLSLLIIGGVGGLLMHKHPEFRIDHWFERTIITLSLAFAGLAVFFSYYVYQGLVEMLSNFMFNSSSSLIGWPQAFQFICFFISVVMFGVFTVVLVFKSVSREREG